MRAGRRALVIALVGLAAATPAAVHADHGVCIVEADLVVPNDVPVSVEVRVTAGNSGTFLIDFDRYDTYTADEEGRISLVIPASVFGSHVVAPSVHFAFTGEQECQSPSMTVRLGLPDTATATRDVAGRSTPVAAAVAGALGLFLWLAWRRRHRPQNM